MAKWKRNERRCHRRYIVEDKKSKTLTALTVSLFSIPTAFNWLRGLDCANVLSVAVVFAPQAVRRHREFRVDVSPLNVSSSGASHFRKRILSVTCTLVHFVNTTFSSFFSLFRACSLFHFSFFYCHNSNDNAARRSINLSSLTPSPLPATSDSIPNCNHKIRKHALWLRLYAGRRVDKHLGRQLTNNRIGLYVDFL